MTDSPRARQVALRAAAAGLAALAEVQRHRGAFDPLLGIFLPPYTVFRIENWRPPTSFFPFVSPARPP